jgi:type IV pilus assembly protein PilN
VILINLLPHREWARKRAQNVYNTLLMLAALAGVLGAGGIYSGYQLAIENQESRNAFLVAENAGLDQEIKEVTELQNQITALKMRLQAVESLQIHRNLPVHLLNETARMLPEGMYLNGLKQDGQNILFSGVAQSQECVSALLRNLASSADGWLSKPELVEIKVDELAFGPRNQRRVYDFTVRAMLGRPSETTSAQPAATPIKGKA